MTTCVTCGSYFRRSPYNSSLECDQCVDQLPCKLFDDEDEVEVHHLLCPNGKTPARFSDD